MKTLHTIFSAMIFSWFIIGPLAANAAEDRPLVTVPHVDLQRYLGTWYEIASYPAWFQKGCTGSTAEYTSLPDGRIRVINRCFKNRLDGPLKESSGKAEVVDPATNARLKVWFFWPFKGDYWIIDLDPDYQWAVVGVPSRKYLWLLSRTPSLDADVHQGILKRLALQGYDPNRLLPTPQPK
jgi:apolipoprotein D and lipocalin family protein